MWSPLLAPHQASSVCRHARLSPTSDVNAQGTPEPAQCPCDKYVHTKSIHGQRIIYLSPTNRNAIVWAG